MPSKADRTGGIGRIATRKLSTSQKRQPKRKTVKVKKTLAERALILARREQAKIKRVDSLESARAVLNQEAVKLYEMHQTHTVAYWKQAILQGNHKIANSRAVSQWNAYLREELKLINDGKRYQPSPSAKDFNTDSLFSALPPGEPRLRICDITSDVRAEWNAMTPNQREEKSAGPVARLSAFREMKQLSTQNVPLAAFHDTRANMALIQGAVSLDLLSAYAMNTDLFS